MTRDQATTAPLDELRDALAEMDGWVKAFDGTWRNRSDRRSGFNHPHPPTLDGADAAMPEGWTWWKASTEWLAQAAHTTMIRVPDTGNKIADLYRLAVLCRIAAKENVG